MAPLVRETKTLAANLRVKIEWVRREENEEADRLASSAYEKLSEKVRKAEPMSKKTNKSLNFYL